jgi:hypothetical protein
LLNDTSTNEKGDEDDNKKSTCGDNMDADHKSADSLEIELMRDPVITKIMEEDYDEKWGEEHYPSSSENPMKGVKHKTKSRSTMRVMAQMTLRVTMRTTITRTRTRPTSLMTTRLPKKRQMCPWKRRSSR